MCQRNALAGRPGKRRADARHHLGGNARPAQGGKFLAAAPKYKRVTAFQPHDYGVLCRLLHQEFFNLRLRHRVAARRFSHINALAAGLCQPQQAGGSQPVIHHAIGAFQQSASAHG